MFDGAIPAVYGVHQKAPFNTLANMSQKGVEAPKFDARRAPCRWQMRFWSREPSWMISRDSSTNLSPSAGLGIGLGIAGHLLETGEFRSSMDFIPPLVASHSWFFFMIFPCQCPWIGDSRDSLPARRQVDELSNQQEFQLRRRPPFPWLGFPKGFPWMGMGQNLLTCCNLL